MTVYIIFTTIGTDAGPFNLYSNVDGYSSAFEVGITRIQLLSGFPSVNVPIGTTIIRAKSFGVCTNFVDLSILTTTSTTLAPTTTSTTTITPTTTTTSSSSSTSTTSTTLSPTTTTTTTTVLGIAVNIKKATSSCNVGTCNLNGTITFDTLYTSDGNIVDTQQIWADAALTIPYSTLGMFKKNDASTGIFYENAGLALLECSEGGGC